MSFKGKASRPLHGIALVFDLEGFSRFFNQPDVNEYVTRYLNHLFDAFTVMIGSGEAYWAPKESTQWLELEPKPAHVKFLGDGGLYVWTSKEKTSDLGVGFIRALVARLIVFEQNFSKIIDACADDVPVVDLPRRIRFGLARGTIYELTHQGKNSKEYIGFCINLASRLQKYCPGLWAIFSARIEINPQDANAMGFTRVVAKKLRGFSNEIVYVSKWDFQKLPSDVRNELFDVIAETDLTEVPAIASDKKA